MIERTPIIQEQKWNRLMEIEELMRYVSVGRNSAAKLGKEADAIVHIGKRVLYDRADIDKHISRLVEEQNSTDIKQVTECLRTQVVLDMVITDEDIDDIMCSALEGGINYWCAGVKVDGDYKGEFASEQISRGGTLILSDCEEKNDKGEPRRYELTKEKFIQGVRMYVEDPTGYDIVEMKKHELHLDPCNVDADIADSIVQYALFAEIIYG